MPPFCVRCCTEFKDRRRLEAHQRSNELCVVQPLGRAPDGLSPEQKEALRSRKTMLLEGTEEDKWSHVFRILFPDVDRGDVPSPCTS